jgi:hypothetical protein
MMNNMNNNNNNNNIIIFEKLMKSILHDNPIITRFDIDWVNVTIISAE